VLDSGREMLEVAQRVDTLHFFVLTDAIADVLPTVQYWPLCLRVHVSRKQRKI
jgi:hypothetical protein